MRFRKGQRAIDWTTLPEQVRFPYANAQEIKAKAQTIIDLLEKDMEMSKVIREYTEIASLASLSRKEIIRILVWAAGKDNE
jgi:hypothetical protein